MRWLIVGWVLLLACSCNNSSSLTATSTAPGQGSGVVAGPAPQATALSGDDGIKQFVLDRETGQMWTIAGGGATAWADDTTLFAPFYPRGIRLLRLDGGSTYLDQIPPTPGVRPSATTSADGEWRLTTDQGASSIQDIDGGRRIAVPANLTFAWSPSGHVLVTGGGRCGNVPVVFVDPDADPPTRAVDLGDRVTRSYEWSPDGSGIALATLSKSTRPEAQILFVTAANARVDVLVPVGQAKLVGGEPIVGPWSPSGAYLLLSLYFGRPCAY